MAINTRHERILDLLRRRGYVTIEEVSARLRVTPQTIRRDLHDLAAQGKLRRHHGGASLPSAIVNTNYALRHVENADAKARMAEAAAELVPEGSSLFLTLGTTIEALASALVGKRDLRVVTNSTAAARILGGSPGISIQLLGGAYLPGIGGVAGSLTTELVARWRCDMLATSIGAVSSDGWLLDYHEEEVAVMRAMHAQARRTMLLADQATVRDVILFPAMRRLPAPGSSAPAPEIEKHDLANAPS